MKSGERFWFFGATLACAGLAVVGTLISSPRGRAQDQGTDSDSRIEQGFEIAPVPLNLDGKNPALVGLGSYIVNTEGCNDCHSAGPATQYVRGGNPFFGQPKQVNPATYLGGGRDFLTVAGPPSPHIISRNLTPTPKTGLPGGDITFDKFLTIIRTGKDFDQLHPNCSATVTTFCFPVNLPPAPTVDGDLLQVMPWPNFKDLTDHEIAAIYEYLKAVPCVQGNYPGTGGPFAGIQPEPADRCSQ
jgi:hypothetical protein